MDLNSFLEELSEEQLSKLYESYWTCQAVLRSLPQLAQQYVLRLLFIEQPLEKKYLDSWVEPTFTSTHVAAVRKLQRLKILRNGKSSQGTEVVQLQKTFRRRIQDSVTGRGSYIENVSPGVEGSCPTTEDLTRYARQQWECLLLFLVGQNKAPPALPQHMTVSAVDVEGLLKSAELMHAGCSRGSGPEGRITKQGFHFLLMDGHQQLWRVLREYIKQAGAAEGRQLSWVISFLMQLGWRQVGRPYSFEVLSPDEQQIAGHMMQLGLLRGWRVKGKTYYAPTPLATSLCGGGLGGGATTEALAGHIMVETNYRVYAYTSSQIQISILQLFCRTDCILPNLYVGTLTRDSINAALACGISGEQIVGYLRKHAHPHIAKRVPVVPEVVSDQVRLWEADSQRVKAQPAYLYREFGDRELFRLSVQHAKVHGFYIWHTEVDDQLACKPEGHEEMKQHIQKMREKLASKATQNGKADGKLYA